jgi:hypothetical protein
MHGTDLLPTCTMRLMYQQTLYVHFDKQDVVMEIIRQHLLGPAPVRYLRVVQKWEKLNVL